VLVQIDDFPQRLLQSPEARGGGARRIPVALGGNRLAIRSDMMKSVDVVVVHPLVT
jgi:hypothetical protein